MTSAEGTVKPYGKVDSSPIANLPLHADYITYVLGDRLSLIFRMAGIQHHTFYLARDCTRKFDGRCEVLYLAVLLVIFRATFRISNPDAGIFGIRFQIR